MGGVLGNLRGWGCVKLVRLVSLSTTLLDIVTSSESRLKFLTIKQLKRINLQINVTGDRMNS